MGADTTYSLITMDFALSPLRSSTAIVVIGGYYRFMYVLKVISNTETESSCWFLARTLAIFELTS